MRQNSPDRTDRSAYFSQRMVPVLWQPLKSNLANLRTALYEFLWIVAVFFLSRFSGHDSTVPLYAVPSVAIKVLNVVGWCPSTSRPRWSDRLVPIFFGVVIMKSCNSL